MEIKKESADLGALSQGAGGASLSKDMSSVCGVIIIDIEVNAGGREGSCEVRFVVS